MVMLLFLVANKFSDFPPQSFSDYLIWRFLQFSEILVFSTETSTCKRFINLANTLKFISNFSRILEATQNGIIKQQQTQFRLIKASFIANSDKIPNQVFVSPTCTTAGISTLFNPFTPRVKL